MENSRFKFRAWNGSRMYSPSIEGFYDINEYFSEIEYLMQYTGLKDKNSVEIYEFMELDNKYEVEFNIRFSAYILTNISTGDIISLSSYMEKKDGKVKITREYTKV